MAFSYTCLNIHLEGSVLVADCTKIGGERRTSRLDLDEYIGVNGEGEFKVGPGSSGFMAWARNVSLETPYLKADLERSDGEWVEDVRFDLDVFVGNFNGDLAFNVPNVVTRGKRMPRS